MTAIMLQGMVCMLENKEEIKNLNKVLDLKGSPMIVCK
jgi:hypothetical protein